MTEEASRSGTSLVREPTFELSLTFEVEWDQIQHVRDAAAATIMSVFADRSLRDSVSMVSAELLENAVKYGTALETGVLRVHYQLAGTDREVVVCVRNRVDVHGGASRENLDALATTLRWLSQFDDPADAYLERLESHYDDPSPDRPKLGLARIAHEGGCRLHHEVAEDGLVVVEARFRI